MKWWILAAMPLCVPFAHAANGSTGASFLEIPVGAAPSAMGGAYSALATDAYAPHWNPAGLGALQSTELAGQHVSYLESINYEQISAVHPLRPGRALGFAVQYLGTGDIDSYDPSGANLHNTYSSHYAAYSLAYGHALNERFSIGMTGKWIEAKLADVSANAYAADLGTWWHPNDRLQLALVVANIGSELKFIEQGDNLPLAVRLGGAFKVRPSLTASAEGVYQRDSDPAARFGVEWRPITAIALRAGYRSDTVRELSALAGFSTGAGLYFWGHEFAYAWLPYGDLGDTHTFSLHLRFGGDEKRNLIRSEHPHERQEAAAYPFRLSETTDPDLLTATLASQSIQ